MALTESMLERIQREEYAHEVYGDLLRSYGFINLSRYDGTTKSISGKPHLISEDYPDYYAGAYISTDGDLTILTTAETSKCRNTVEKIANKDKFILKPISKIK